MPKGRKRAVLQTGNGATRCRFFFAVGPRAAQFSHPKAIEKHS